MKIKLFPSVLLLLFILFQACSNPSSQVDLLDEPAVGDLASAISTTSVPELVVPEQAETVRPQNIEEAVIAEPNPVRTLLDDFYQWYFEQPGEEIFNERSYEDHPALSGIFKSDTGYLLDSFTNQSGYDPFTCAQTFLPNLTFNQIFINGGEAYALGEVVEDNKTVHFLVVQLGKGEGDWKIDAIYCPFAPQTTAIAFYTAYLGYITSGKDTELGVGDPENPFEDGFFSELFMLSEAYRNQIIELRGQGTSSDPILQTQTLPVNFWVEPGQEGEVITVRLTYGPQSARYYDLHLKQGPPLYWQIDNITTEAIPTFDPLAHPEVDIYDWKVFESEDFLFQFRYPQDWSIKQANLSEIPPDDPLQQTFFFYPSWAEPNLPILWLSILIGDESDIMNYYVTESHQRVEINGMMVGIDRDQFDTRYVFQHPDMENTWIVIGDTSPGVPGREQYAQALDPVIAPLLRTVEFGSESKQSSR
jgi:hypothetical protein